jgi:Asp/Glu/hydantoin racemase
MSALTARRLVNYMVSAELAGADAVMVTCSSVGEAVDMAAPLLNIPAYRVDQPMADQAVATAVRIGVAATLNTTLNPTMNLIQKRAALKEKSIELVPMLCEGAFEAVIAGDTATHDRIVADGLEKLAADAQVIVLAQASMARVAQQLPEKKDKTPILSSPQLAVAYLAAQLARA